MESDVGRWRFISGSRLLNVLLKKSIFNSVRESFLQRLERQLVVSVSSYRLTAVLSDFIVFTVTF